jgi:hypothetical protein
MSVDEKPNACTLIELARLDERIKALKEDVRRTEDTARRETELAATELSRRLELLNGHQAEMRAHSANFVTRDLHDTLQASMTEKLEAAQSRLSERVKPLEGHITPIYTACGLTFLCALTALIAFLMHLHNG